MSFYLSNALGFFIQLAPCALMCFLPFPEESFRVPKRAVLLGAAGVTALLAALFPAALRASGSEMLGDLLMLLAAALVLGAVLGLVREAAVRKVLAVFVVLFYAVVQFWLMNTVWLVLPPERFASRAAWGPYPPMTAALYAASAAVTLPLTLRFVLRPLGELLREMEPGEMRREFAAAAASTALMVAAMMYAYNRGYSAAYFPVITLLELLLILGQALIYWLVFRESLRRQRDSQRRRALEIQKLQYDNISREMENTRRLRHDLRHHLNVLGALNAQNRQEEIAAYLREYGAVADRLDHMVISGDPVVDSVLGYYLTQAEELAVPVTCQVSLGGGSGLEPTDMTVLLGNLLENALTALERLPEDRRQLSVEMSAEKAMVLLRIRNTCPERDDSGGPSGWETFAGAGRRGVGLRSVAAIAEKYNGSALFQRRDGVFTTRVILSPKQG